ncbi:hypothetical protein KBD87_03535 [Candidatus Saccharibacteria bacterium]|nr:hypothetical protein [Candidatus Saccharibacteria bacterium]
MQRTQISGAFNDLKFGLDQNALVIIPRLRYRFKHFNASSSVRVAALESGYWAVIDSTRQNCDLVILKDISHVVELIKSLVGEDGRIYATCLDGREVEIVTELADRIERILVRFLAEKKSNIARKQAALKKLLNQRPN